MTEHQILLFLGAATFVSVTLTIIIWLRLTRRKILLKAGNEAHTVLINSLKAEKETVEKKLSQQTDEIKELTALIATLKADNRHLELRLTQTETDRQQMLKQFETLSGDILRHQGTQFSEQNIEAVRRLLEPMAEKLGLFEKKVAETYEKGLRDQVDLRAELKKLHELNQQIGSEAAALTHALRTDSATQGTWGEVVLQRILERSGLTEGESFLTQVSATDDAGQRWRPDVVILLPENRHIIIDAKVSLTAWEQYVNATDDNSRQKWLQAHTDSVRHHVTSLGQRDYSSLPQFNTPDFVVLFMPVEAAFGAALQADTTLFQLAWDQRVVLTGPATLLATLRTIASVWRIEQQNRNVREIARQGGLLYDRLMAFADEMNKIGIQIDRLHNTWQKASDKLASGRGNLIARASRLKQLGANTKNQNKFSPDETELTDDET